MLSHQHAASPSPGTLPTADPEVPALRPPCLMTVAIHAAARALDARTVVTELDERAVERIAGDAVAVARRHGAVTLEIGYVPSAAADRLLEPLRGLEGEGVRALTRPFGGRPARRPPEPARPEPARLEPARPEGAPAADPFGLDADFHARWLPLLRFFFERYWRIAAAGVEHVPATGSVIVAANHSGAVPADAAMLAAALALRHPARRRLRVLYDRFVDDLPWIAGPYRRFGAVPASLANAELLLARGEAVGLFPEGLAGLEKSWPERYRLRPFKSGAARLAIRTGSPIVPVAIVGAEEAYPVVARLYRTGDLVGLPWIPVTPLFPLCGLAGALPLPSRWYMRFCPPIQPPAVAPGEERDAIAALTARLRTAVDDALDDLLAHRRAIFW